MSDCITALIAALVIACLLGDGKENRCGRDHGSCSGGDRCNSSCC